MFQHLLLILQEVLCKTNNYSMNFKTAATKWRIDNECTARQVCLNSINPLKLVDTGMYLSIDHPFTGASPVAIVQCVIKSLTTCQL